MQHLWPMPSSHRHTALHCGIARPMWKWKMKCSAQNNNIKSVYNVWPVVIRTHTSTNAHTQGTVTTTTTTIMIGTKRRDPLQFPRTKNNWILNDGNLSNLCLCGCLGVRARVCSHEAYYILCRQSNEIELSRIVYIGLMLKAYWWICARYAPFAQDTNRF